MDKNLFTIREEHLDSGLRGFPIGYCITSSVDPEKGLFYRGIPVSELAKYSVEEVMYLLIEGALPGKRQLKKFNEELCKRAKVSKRVKEAVVALPKMKDQVKVYATAVLLLGELEGSGDLCEDFLNLMAKLPEITALVINHGNEWGRTSESKPELGIVKNFCQMITCKKIVDWELFEEILRLFLILHMDHGGGNLSAFVAKAVASGHQDLYGSFAASLLALGGSRHGKANEDSLTFVRKAYRELGDSATAESVSTYIKDLLAEGGLVYGFGHAVLSGEDQRAKILFDFSKKYFADNPLVNVACLLREQVPVVLKENPKIQNPYNNVDSISGVLLAAIGFDFPPYFPVLFGMSRLVGVGRQIIYETLEARGNKGVPIYRPKYLYKKS